MIRNRDANPPRQTHSASRREFLKRGALGAGSLAAGLGVGSRTRGSFDAPAVGSGENRPDFLFIMCDQLGMDAISAHGCSDVDTPNIDRLIERGVSFTESHSTNPVCSPARSSLLTGRMPVETGVITNNRHIHPSCPTMGQWLAEAGYDTYYCGKWHLPEGYPVKLDGFNVLPVGGGQGDLVDTVVSRSCETFLKNRTASKPFLLVSSLMQPHDICYWAIKGKLLVPEEPAFQRLAGHLPALPPNHRSRPAAPEKLARARYRGFSDAQWQYYIYIYYRQVEMVDAEIGRMLDALDQTGRADNTVVVLTSDHGEGRGRHQHVQKWYPYEEGVKVPMVVSYPGEIAEGVIDREHLVSGVDVMSTFCDYAQTAPPADCVGRSLRPLLEEKRTEWREFVCSEHHVVGRMLRSAQYKYVRYEGDPVEQLFDIQADPWETKNLYQEAALADVVADHRKMLADWQATLKTVEPMPDVSRRRRRS